MKNLLLYMLLVCLPPFTAYSFADSSKTKKPAVKKTVVKQVDQKAATAGEKKCTSSCQDNCAEKCGNSTDYFIDKDNDGICDSRAKGMGFNSKNRCSEDGCAKQMKKKNK